MNVVVEQRNVYRALALCLELNSFLPQVGMRILEQQATFIAVIHKLISPLLAQNHQGVDT